MYNAAMRITVEERRRVIDTVSRYVGPGSRVWLFGSRVDDEKRGGDVDLYVEAVDLPPSLRLETELVMGVAIEQIFDDSSVDIVFRYPGEEEQPIHRIAKRTGVPL